METSPLSIHSDDSSSSSSTDCEDLLDPRSSKFNPKLALLCKESAVSIPNPEAPLYLNVFDLEKSIPDPRREPVSKSVLDKSKAQVNKKKTRA